MLLSPRAHEALNSVETITPRIMIGTFNGNPLTTVICGYSPTNVSDEIDVDHFYTDLSTVVRQVPKHNVLVLGGDMNAQLGKYDGYIHSYHEVSNRNGKKLHDFLKENKLICLNTKYQRKSGQLWTHTYPNGTKAQLDYVFINNKWKNSAMNCRPFNSFENVSSDHRIVSAKFRLSLRANKAKSTQYPPYDWSQLHNNDGIRQSFTLSLRNRFEALQTENNTPNETFENLVTACKEVAEKEMPLKPKLKKHVPWETEEIAKKREELKKAAKSKNEIPSRANKTRFKRAQTALTNIYEAEQTAYLQSKINLIASANANKQAATAWKTVNEICNRKGANKAKLKADNQKDRLDLWKQHFQNLLGKPPNILDNPVKRIIETELDIKKGNFDMKEISSALNKLSNGKACGLDNIPAEVWMTGKFNQELLDLCNAVYNQNPIEKWTKGCLLPFPKKGNLGVTTNYRGITLTSIAAKIYNLLLLNRIRPAMESKLRKNQNGFRQNRSTSAQILTVRRIIEGVKAKKLQAVLLFVDFSKAFDSIHRGKMEEILLAYGIPQETVSAIMMLYRNTQSMVRSPDGDTDFFDILAGVLQGDTLAPYLFVICLDYVLRTSADAHKELGLTLEKAKSRRYPEQKITDADYADDLALFSDSIADATSLLHYVEDAAQKIGLYVNARKTEFLCYNTTGTMKSLSGDNIKQQEEFVYLGSNIASTKRDIEIRLGKAWGALDRLNKIWKSNLHANLKRDFFRATVESVLVYGSSTWTLTKHLEKSLDGAYTRMLRAVLNISWKQHPTKKELYGNIPPLSVIIRERRMRFAGHCWRNKDELASDVLLWHPRQGKTPIGRPARTYIDQLRDDSGITSEDLSTAMLDRQGWKERVKTVRASSTW